MYSLATLNDHHTTFDLQNTFPFFLFFFFLFFFFFFTMEEFRGSVIQFFTMAHDNKEEKKSVSCLNVRNSESSVFISRPVICQLLVLGKDREDLEIERIKS